MKNLKLKSARAAKDMSQADLAKAVGVSRQTINSIEKGDYNPTINLRIAICKALSPESQGKCPAPPWSVSVPPCLCPTSLICYRNMVSYPAMNFKNFHNNL